MRKTRLLAAALSGAFAIGLLAATPTPALAADGWQATKDVAESRYHRNQNDHFVPCRYTDGQRGKGCFQPSGERFWVKDIACNFEATVIRWRFYRDGGLHRAGDIFSRSCAFGWTMLNKSFAENYSLKYRVCEGNRPNVNDCSPWDWVQT